MSVNSEQAVVGFGEHIATELIRVCQDPAELTSGWWAVMQTFEGEFYGFEFARPTSSLADLLPTPYVTAASARRELWTSNISQRAYENGVEEVRRAIERGWVYQTNYCRILKQAIEPNFDFVELYRKLLSGNPAPHATLFHLPRNVTGLLRDIKIASASPELFLSRQGRLLKSSPIKGTATSAKDMLDKDSAENVMIVDLIRNDLSHVCKPGTVLVPDMLRLEEHPGLVHLVSDVTGELHDGFDWQQILQAMCPAGSVSGAPKSSSLQLISQVEPEKREVYCGVLGWIDVDENTAELAVAIRTFWQSLSAAEPTICFGTGAGITYDSDPAGEWFETELKANHLLGIASS